MLMLGPAHVVAQRPAEELAFCLGYLGLRHADLAEESLHSLPPCVGQFRARWDGPWVIMWKMAVVYGWQSGGGFSIAPPEQALVLVQLGVVRLARPRLGDEDDGDPVRAVCGFMVVNEAAELLLSTLMQTPISFSASRRAAWLCGSPATRSEERRRLTPEGAAVFSNAG